MTAVVRTRSSSRRISIITILSIALAIVGLFFIWNGSDAPGGAKPVTAEPRPAPGTAWRVAAPSVPTNVSSRAPVAVPDSSKASHAMPPWQVSLQPAVVAATRVESLAEYQVQMEHWSCEGNQCVGEFRIPPAIQAGRKLSTAAQIFDSVKKQMAQENVDVSLESVHPGPQGMAVSLQFTPNEAIQGSYYTPAEIAAIRLESFEQGRKAAGQALDQRGQVATH